MNEKKTDEPKKLKSLKLVRETLCQLDGGGPTHVVAGRPFSRGHHCTLSWDG